VNGAGAGAVPRHLLCPYLPAAGSTLKSSGAAGDYRKIRKLLVGELADVLVDEGEFCCADDLLEKIR
jgi:hypothetical protein